MVALLCAAAALMLWRRSAVRRERALAERFVERQVQTASTAHGLHASNAPQPPRPAAGASAIEMQTGVRARIAQVRAFVGNLLNRAGIERPGALVTTTLAVAGFGALWAGLRAGPALGAGVAAFVLIAVYAWLTWRAQKRYQRIVRQLPPFLDGIVRMIVIGHSVPAAFQSALGSAEAPLSECLNRALPMLRTGMEIDHALGAVARIYRVRELELVGSVLRVSVKYGGRSDVMLDRMAALMRDLEQADRELIALSTETRLSSWVLGLLPILLGTMVILTNPAYFDAMWTDTLGKRLVYMAVALQALGAWMLYRLARVRT
ncbi:type II secretion system F family protein [Caballeronia sp. LZ065]|uniref:type II secretion system F family protein n=1 Tax=Caballeronia sp. LZ065 TaxID=3038571 RepID=UPI00285732C6|nr:type II secretion system F family protein [Caballeronia sp. LZ065]MDR5782095.1 type II secretion system F family protein [Caballeronia sp. LZ065]